MVAHSDALDQLRRHIIAAGGGFLRHVQWTPGITCTTCAGIPGRGYTQCYQCHGREGSVGLADALAFVTYAPKDGQAGHVMNAYKTRGETTYRLVSALLAYAVVAHWHCIPPRGQSRPDAWAHVPSLSGRQGDHPLADIASRVMRTIPTVEVAPGHVQRSPRAFDPAHFTVRRSSARHVLLLEDTWVTGSHLQSASAALKSAGVTRVTGLAVARWLDPEWGDTRAFIDTLAADFDPARCPYTGEWC